MDMVSRTNILNVHYIPLDISSDFSKFQDATLEMDY